MRFSISEDATTNNVQRLEVVKNREGSSLVILAAKAGVVDRSFYHEEHRPFDPDEYEQLLEITIENGEVKIQAPGGGS